ncbi:MAG TPA: oligosaccharide flippase family protein [Sphingopyxis sp.]|uniref:oligosaccharide flippase family protein n=1 Tax=Sphingopyxis sp. TaxID=1908224 RepID=UPI002E358192|nr:oligosaccharide flippase family protein [Sphingopyxis sp.]HEX2812379.1 oligosaccharide flippase family protein [Sphingopyxis sp.]
MQGRFWTNVAGVLSGTAVAQAIPVLGALVLARLFLPDAFGIYSVWLGFVLILAVTLTLRLETALPIIDDGRSREDAAGLIFVTIVLVGIAALLISLLLLAMGLISGTVAKPYMLGLVVLAAMLSATTETWQGVASADGTYRILVKIRIGRSASILICQITASLVSRVPEALIIGHLVGLVFAILMAQWFRPLPLPSIEGLGSRLVAFWRRYPRFPGFALPADLMSAVSLQLPLFILSARFGPHVAGIFALALRVLLTPVGLIGRSILDVFRRYAADAFRTRGECRSVYISTLRVLSIFSLLLAAGIVLLAEPAFAFVFGEVWRQAGTFAIWLAPFVALGFMASPLSYVFYIVGRQNVDLAWQTGRFAVVLAAMFVPHDVRGVILAYSAGYSLMYVLYIYLSYTASKGRVDDRDN